MPSQPAKRPQFYDHDSTHPSAHAARVPRHQRDMRQEDEPADDLVEARRQLGWGLIPHAHDADDD